MAQLLPRNLAALCRCVPRGIVWTYLKGLIWKEFVLAIKTIDTEYYRGIVDRFLKHIVCVRLDILASNNWFLFHNNTPAHNMMSIRQFLAKKNVISSAAPPPVPPLYPKYLSDLVLVDYFVFWKLKLKGCQFDDAPTIQNMYRIVHERVSVYWRHASTNK